MVSIPTLGLYLQTCEVQLQLVTDRSFWCGVRTAQQTAFIDGIETRVRSHKGIVTAAHNPIIYNHLIREIDRRLTFGNHTTYVTTADDSTEHGGIWYVIDFVAIGCALKDNG